MVKTALGNTSAVAGMADEEKLDVQVGLLVGLVRSEGFDRSAIDRLLPRAKERAERLPG